MKRIFSLLLAGLLVFLLAACGAPAAPALPDAGPDGSSALKLDTLNVEFVIGERDADELMQLQAELPPLLLSALENENVTVETVNITFGASAEATAQALEDGSVDLAFVPSGVYLEHEDALRLIALEAAPVPASELLSAEDLNEIEGVDESSLFYEEAVVLRGELPHDLARAAARALVMLCAYAGGNAALRQYGSASYLIGADPNVLLAPYRAYLDRAQ